MNNADKLNNLATAFLVGPVTILWVTGRKVPKLLLVAYIGLTIWQMYRAVTDLSGAPTL